MGLFSKKPGGTLFGNLLRSQVSKYTGGALGSGAQKIELGQTQTNAQLAKMGVGVGTSISSSPLDPITAAPNVETLIGGLTKTLNNGMTQNVAIDTKTILMVGGAIVAAALLFKKK